MEKTGKLLQCDEAKAFIDRVNDAVTRNLLNMALVHVVKRFFIDKEEAPQGDFDMVYFAKVLESFFSEHQVLSRTLAGEKVGAWFDEES
jgi:hypothetical protein